MPTATSPLASRPRVKRSLQHRGSRGHLRPCVVEINDIENGTEFSPAKLKRVAGALQVPLPISCPRNVDRQNEVAVPPPSAAKRSAP